MSARRDLDFDNPLDPAPSGPHTVVPDHDAADRQGLRRVTLARSSSGRCHHCSRAFETLAGAVSHGRSAGHLVKGTYTASYLYVPVEDGAA